MKKSHFYFICFLSHVNTDQTTWKKQAATIAVHVEVLLPKMNRPGRKKAQKGKLAAVFNFISSCFCLSSPRSLKRVITSSPYYEPFPNASMVKACSASWAAIFLFQELTFSFLCPLLLFFCLHSHGGKLHQGSLTCDQSLPLSGLVLSSACSKVQLSF